MEKTKYLEQICKIGQGSDCCRYVVAGAPGITCAKLSGLKETIDIRVKLGRFIAMGDNCAGLPDNQLITQTPIPDEQIPKETSSD